MDNEKEYQNMVDRYVALHASPLNSAQKQEEWKGAFDMHKESGTYVETVPFIQRKYDIASSGVYVPAPEMTQPSDPVRRKAAPIASGVLDYFPDALWAVAECSKKGNDQHNPGQPLHWDKTKSMDHADCILRHLIDRGTMDGDGIRHSAKVAWRALALLQIEIEKEKNNVSR